MVQPVRIKCSLGDEVFELQSMSGEERLGTPFRYELQLISTQHDVQADALLGQAMTVSVKVVSRAERHYNGIVSQFRYLGSDGRHSRYAVTLRPWLFLLTRSAQSRILQEQSVPDIIKAVFRGHGFSDFSEALTGSYPAREYCVQYRESDFNFVSRLMEHEGIYYFFEHADGKHTMVLMDAQSVHETVPGYEELALRRRSADERDSDPSFTAWSASDAFQAGAYSLRDYDFRKPNVDLTVRASVSQAFSHGALEVYDYPGCYVDCAVGEQQARKRIEALKAQRTVFSATHTGIGLFTGAVVKLIEHPRASANAEYLLTGQRFDLVAGANESAHPGEVHFSGEATLITRTTSFVPPRQTPAPTVQGPQTATVAGSGDVWTDAYGRVKLKFHWDRKGTGDAQSSCWVRVSQNSASGGWGSMYIPHVGDEVIVDFLEGDPDQPIVTGRVYNANKMPPLTLPANDKKSILRDHYGNELIFDGTAGTEHITLHSPSKFSMLQLGKSVRTFTSSASTTYSLKASSAYTLGNSVNYALGHTFTLTRGAWLGVKFGVGLDVTLGATVAVTGGIKASCSTGIAFELSMSSKGSYTFDNQWTVAKGDLSVRSEKDVLIDSQKRTIITAGKKDHPLFLADDNGISLSFDPSSSGRPMTALSGWARARSAAAAAATAACAGFSIWSFTSQMAKNVERQNGTTLEVDAELSSMEKFTLGDLGAYGALAIGLVSTFAGKPPTAADPKHTNPTAKLSMKDDLLEIWAGEKQHTLIKLHKPTGVTIETEKNIILDSQGAIAYKAKKDIDVSANQTNFDTIISHRNLKVLK